MRRLAFLLLLPLLCAQSADYTIQPALKVAHPAQSQLLAIGVAGSRVVAVGERGLIIYSDDAGISWQQARVPVSQTLTALSFATAEHGWVVGHGGVILHSSDGGASWQQQFDGESANQQWLDDSLRRQAYLNQSIQEAAPGLKVILERELEEVIYEVEDTELALETGPSDPFLDIMFIDERKGWAVGAYGLLFRTINGGLRWDLATAGIENPDRYHYYKLAMSEDDQMYLVGEAGLAYRSDDQGKNWERLSLDYDGSLFGVLTPDADTVLCFGLRGNIFISTDSGDTWADAVIEGNPRLSFYGGDVVGDSSLVVVGAGGVLASSSDHGRQFKADTHSSRSTFSSVVAVGEDLLLVGMDGVQRISAAQQSANGGDSDD